MCTSHWVRRVIDDIVADHMLSRHAGRSYVCARYEDISYAFTICEGRPYALMICGPAICFHDMREDHMISRYGGSYYLSTIYGQLNKNTIRPVQCHYQEKGFVWGHLLAEAEAPREAGRNSERTITAT